MYFSMCWSKLGINPPQTHMYTTVISKWRPIYWYYNSKTHKFSNYCDKITYGGHLECHKHDYEEKMNNHFKMTVHSRWPALPSTCSVSSKPFIFHEPNSDMKRVLCKICSNSVVFRCILWTFNVTLRCLSHWFSYGLWPYWIIRPYWFHICGAVCHEQT